MKYTKELKNMVCVKTCRTHGPAPIPQEGSFDKVKEVGGISGFSHSVGHLRHEAGRL